jgi:hypothetical protein
MGDAHRAPGVYGVELVREQTLATALWAPSINLRPPKIPLSLRVGIGLKECW